MGKRTYLNWLTMSVLIFICIVISVYAFNITRNAYSKHQLMTVASKGNIISIEPVPRNTTVELPACKIQGNENVVSFLEAIHLKRRRGRCACEGSIILKICKDNSELAIISFHHGRHIRWLNGPWSSDMPLTEESKKQLKEWLNKMSLEADTKLKLVSEIFQEKLK